MNTEIVVAGAGHNSLVTAAYLAVAGYEVLVLDSRHIPGGGAASEELLGPGYTIDSCSTGHTLIQTNPLLLEDELGLLGQYGLEYLKPDPFAHVAFPDGRHLTAWLDRERTIEEFARYSKRDGEAYRRLLDEYDEVKHIFAASQFTPIGFGPPLEQMLAEHPRGSVWLRRRAMSAFDVIRHEFEDPHTQAFLLWQAYQTLVPVDSDGSGQLAYSLVFGRQRRSWTIPRGGSGALTDALVACIAEHGGTVVCNKRVTRLLVDGGRCTGVETEDGERYTASRPSCRRSTSSTCSRWRRPTPGTRASATASTRSTSACRRWPSTWARPRRRCSRRPTGRAARCRPASPASRRTCSSTAARCATAATWRTRRGCSSPARRWSTRRARRTATTRSSSSARSPTASRRSAPSRRTASSRGCRRVAPGFARDVIGERLIKFPEDIEAANEHMIRGTFHGGNRTYPQSGALRPAPGWAAHRMPIEGLYQTGGTTHPGGSITGAPGRNAAVVMLHDLGRDIEEVVRDAGRARAVGD